MSPADNHDRDLAVSLPAQDVGPLPGVIVDDILSLLCDLPPVCRRHRQLRKDCVDRLRGNFHMPFFVDHEVDSDEFQAHANILMKTLENVPDDDLTMALNWFWPEQIIAVFDRAHVCDKLELTWGLLDLIRYTVVHPALGCLMDGLEATESGDADFLKARIRSQPGLPKFLRDFVDLIPDNDEHFVDLFASCNGMLKMCQDREYDLADRDRLLLLASCGIRFSFDQFLQTVKVTAESLPKIFPMLKIDLDDRFWPEIVECLHHFLDRRDLLAAFVRIPIIRDSFLYSLEGPDHVCMMFLDCRDLFKATLETDVALVTEIANDRDVNGETFLHRVCLEGDPIVLDLALSIPGIALNIVTSLNQGPVDVLINIIEIIFNISILRLSRLIQSAPVSFLRRLAAALNIAPHEEIALMARSHPGQFTTALVAMIDSNRYWIESIKDLLLNAEQFHRQFRHFADTATVQFPECVKRRKF